MNDNSFYIWGSYGLAALVFAIELLSVRQWRMRTLRELRQERAAGDDE